MRPACPSRARSAAPRGMRARCLALSRGLGHADARDAAGRRPAYRGHDDTLLRSTRQHLHAQIAEALEAHSPELMDTQPELFAQHYAEAGLIQEPIVCWSKAGRRSAARSEVGMIGRACRN